MIYSMVNHQQYEYQITDNLVFFVLMSLNFVQAFIMTLAACKKSMIIPAIVTSIVATVTKASTIIAYGLMFEESNLSFALQRGTFYIFTALVLYLLLLCSQELIATHRSYKMSQLGKAFQEVQEEWKQS